MARIPTPIPSSVASGVKSLFSGPLFDILWAVFVTVVLFAIAIILIEISPFFGAAVGGAIVAVIINDDVRQVVRDLYTRDFFRIKL